MSRPLDGWTIVFDLDGTLVESAPHLLAALNRTLAASGLAPVALPVIRTMIGEGARAMIRKGFAHHGQAIDGTELDAAWEIFITHYRANIAVDSYLFEGVEEALDTLSIHGATLAVATNKSQSLADDVLRALGIHERFAAIRGPDAVSEKKPSALHLTETIAAAGGIKNRAIMIGDSVTDEKAAHNAGLPFIFVPFGYESAGLDDITAHSVIHHFSEISDVVLAIAA